MIGRLSGTLAEKRPPQLLLDVNGVGYELEAPMSTFYALPEAGQRALLLTHLVVREDAHLLYGFATAAERDLFRSLIRISGVGPKMALGVLSGISVPDFLLCVRMGDAAKLTRLPGIGKKSAERLIMEMKSRLGEAAGALPSAAAGSAPQSPLDEAVGALVALGYKPADAAAMARRVAGEGASSEDIIRQALRTVLR